MDKQFYFAEGEDIKRMMGVLQLSGIHSAVSNKRNLVRLKYRCTLKSEIVDFHIVLNVDNSIFSKSKVWTTLFLIKMTL